MKDFNTFTSIVCSSGQVESAFQDISGFAQWWRIVMRLHGKPANTGLSRAERLEILASGFRFYGNLYRALGACLIALAPALFLVGTDLPPAHGDYWAILSAASGAYLWAVSALGYYGAVKLGEGKAQSIPALIAFMVIIVAFLSGFLTVLSVAVEAMTANGAMANIAMFGALFAVGAGSYLIEIVYLATEARRLVRDVDAAKAAPTM